MNYLFIMNSTGTCMWRVYPIAEALRKAGHEVVTLNLNQLSDNSLTLISEWADVLTFQMVCAKDLVERAKMAGTFTIFDADDLIESVPPQHPQFKTTKKRKYQNDFKYMLNNVDLITVSTDTLYERYKSYGHIKKVENYLPLLWERSHQPTHSKVVRVGWAGGMSHQEDLDFIAPVMKKVVNCRYKKEQLVKFVYTGGGGWNTENPDFLWKFEKDHFADIPPTRKEYYTGSKPEIWPDRLNSMRLDIALAPLDDNEFSRCKSQIKYYEYAINHWPGVYQAFMYTNVIHGETGFLATTPEEWEHYIKLLINNPKLRKDMGERAYQHVKDHYTFEGNLGVWLDVYRYAGENSRHRDSQFVLSPGGGDGAGLPGKARSAVQRGDVKPKLQRSPKRANHHRRVGNAGDQKTGTKRTKRSVPRSSGQSQQKATLGKNPRTRRKSQTPRPTAK